MSSDPVGESSEPVSEAKPKRVVIFDDAPPRRPWVSAPFFLWTPLFVFVVGLIVYFYFPDAMNDAIKQGYAAYETYVAPLIEKPPVPEAPKPVAKAAPAPPPPVQTYTMTEIRDAIQQHLIENHYADGTSQFDWTKLTYIDPSDLDYALYVKMTGGRQEYCLGSVALNMARHEMLVTSRLVGW